MLQLQGLNRESKIELQQALQPRRYRSFLGNGCQGRAASPGWTSHSPGHVRIWNVEDEVSGP